MKDPVTLVALFFGKKMIKNWQYTFSAVRNFSFFPLLD